jgi:hypothetical protein
MEPEETEIGLTDSFIQAINIRSITTLWKEINESINEAGRLSDLLSGDDGTQTAGVHGLQMAYDRLTEAKMWVGESLAEVGKA